MWSPRSDSSLSSLGMMSSPPGEEELRWARSLRRGDARPLTAHESTAVTPTRRSKPPARSPAPLKTALATDNDRLKARCHAHLVRSSLAR
jgi:hypothetical protein